MKYKGFDTGMDATSSKLPTHRLGVQGTDPTDEVDRYPGYVGYFSHGFAKCVCSS